MSKFKKGDRVVVLESALEHSYPEEFLGLNTIDDIEIVSPSNRIYFKGHGFVCHEDNIILATKLHEAMK